MIKLKSISNKQIIILFTTIILTVLYYFMALYYVRITPTRKNIVFFHLVFGSLIDNIWIDFYQYIWQFILSFLMFFIIPLVIIKFYFKEKLKHYGMQWGKKRFNLMWTLIGLAIAPLFLFISNDPVILNEYPLTKLVLGNIGLFFIFNIIYLFYYIGYEFIFRSYLQFGLLKRDPSKKSIILVLTIQTLITTLFHIGKPLTELIAALAIGPLFGYLTIKGKSIVWPVLVFHSLIGIITNIAGFIFV